MARQVAQGSIRFVQLVADGEPYQAGTAVASSVALSGAALTAVQATATALGTAADAAGDPTVIGLLKQIAENTTPVP